MELKNAVDENATIKSAFNQLQTYKNTIPSLFTYNESVQSALRRNIRRILRLHGYPPDLQEKAVETVITQAKMLAEDLLSSNGH